MCNITCIIFGTKYLRGRDIKGKKVLEIGSMDVNGSLRSFVESRNPEQYIGVDLSQGKGVDFVCDAEKLLDIFEPDSFDIVISTELLEHVKNWKQVIHNIKTVCKPGGIILVTTRSLGFPYHEYPFDFWRYETQDLLKIFSDCSMEVLEKDTLAPGVFMKAEKPFNFSEIDLLNFELYSIIAGKRIENISDQNLKSWYFRRLNFKMLLKKRILIVLSTLSRLFRLNV